MTDYQRTQCKVLVKLAIADYKSAMNADDYKVIDSRNMEEGLCHYFNRCGNNEVVKIINAEINWLLGDVPKIAHFPFYVKALGYTSFISCLAPRIEFMENQLIKSFE